MKKILLVARSNSSWFGLTSRLREAEWDVEIISPEAAKDCSLAILESTVILLDMALPQLEAWSLLETLNTAWDSSPALPVFGLCTAMPDHNEIIKALKLGAEDLLSSDINRNLLMARLDSCYRRYFGKERNPVTTSVYGHLRMDTKCRQVWIRKRLLLPRPKGIGASEFAQISDLTRKEFDLLYLLLSRPDRVLSRKEILAAVWGSTESSFPRTVDKHVETLRGKLNGAGKFIVTVPSVGYKFSEEDV